MQFSLDHKTASLSVGDFSDFALGPRDSFGGPQGLWRAQLGQHWHNELKTQIVREHTVGGTLRPDVLFEVPIEGRLAHRGWSITLTGRIDQIIGPTLREIKTVTRPLPTEESTLRADYPAYFLQLSTYVILLRASALNPPLSALNPQRSTPNCSPLRSELVFVEASSGLAQTIALTPFDEALVHHQLDALVQFLDQQLRARERRRTLHFRPPFTDLRPGQETIQADLRAAFGCVESPESSVQHSGEDSPTLDARHSTAAPPLAALHSQSATILLFEAPTGYGKTGCVLEFALSQLQSGRFTRLIWLTGKSTGQLQVVRTLEQMTAVASSGPRPGQPREATQPAPTPSPPQPASPPAPPTPLSPTPATSNPIGYFKSSRFGRTPGTSTPIGYFDSSPQRTPLAQSNPIGYSGQSTAGKQPNQSTLLGYLLPGAPLAFWQVRSKSEHCVNHTYHCVREGCDYLNGAAERWPGSGLSRYYLDETQPHDLDTLRAAGKAAHICPYEITRAALAFNDVWIGDYNYVFAPDNRGLFFDQPGFDPRTTLLAIDEAHNLPTRVADAYSHRANDTDARLLLAELDHLRAPGPLLLAVEAWTMLLAALQPTDTIDAALESELHDCIERLVRLTATLPLDYTALGPKHSETLWQFTALDEFLADPNLRRLLWCPRAGELNFTCTDATAAIGETLNRFGGAILMSATLQPYATMAAACGIIQVGRGVPAEPSSVGKSDVVPASASRLVGTTRPTTYATLHAPAPWRENAYDVAVDTRVETTYKQRANYYGTTAATIEAMHAAASAQRAKPNVQPSTLNPQLSGSSPSGSELSTLSSQLSTSSASPTIAVFFPSYAYAESVLRALENSNSVLRVALQPKLPDLAAQNAWVEESLALTDALFLVLGSSFAEGIDLLGGRVTHAMVVGPALPEVNPVQKARLETYAGLGREAAFRRVYQIPGLQKVNQALGRLVRAPGQKAKVLLHCRRFADTSYSSLLAMEYQFYREISTVDELRAWLNETPTQA